jgi:hypothetical protein
MSEEDESTARTEKWDPILKIGLLIGFSISIIVLVVVNVHDLLRSKAQFESWYPQFNYSFTAIATTQCVPQYQTYLYGTRKNITLDEFNGAETITMFVEPMMSCILNGSSEYIKSCLGSAQVMLGLTPTIIALLGASTEEVSLMGLIGRRRFLAFLLAAASPAIYTSRAFEYRNPSEIIKERLRHHHINFTLDIKKRKYFVVLEYVFALAAFANVATVSWQLGLKSINGVSPNVALMPMLWILLSIPAHLAGAVIFNLKARRVDGPTSRLPEPTDRTNLKGLIQNPRPTVQRWTSIYWDTIRREFWTHPDQGPDEKIHIQWFKETRLFTISAWLLSVFIILHIILGTLIMSSTNFIGPRDALGIMTRYIISAVTCRVILVYELAIARVGYRNALLERRV